jgi:hypothetical protein
MLYQFIPTGDGRDYNTGLPEIPPAVLALF